MKRDSGGVRARALAAQIGARIATDGVSLDKALGEAASLPERDAALVRALVFGTCRWHHRLEWQLARLLTRPGQKLKPQLAALLRVGLFQLQGLRVPDHAAVATTVEAAALLGLPRAKGLVNAVLRNYLREREALEREQASVPEARYSYPGWLIERLREDWPRDWERMLEAGNVQPPMWLRVNLVRTTREACKTELEAHGLEVAVGESSSAALLLSAPCATRDLPGYSAGMLSVQDGAAQLAAGLLDLAAGQRVLDACAAPGGKTAHILEACPGLDELWALDREAARLDTVRENLDRLGLAAHLHLADASRPADWWDDRPFDRILLDAPCSALGVIRRHPDIKLLREPQDLPRTAARQAALLEALWPLLVPGGRLVYATCTMTHAENRDQIAAFMARHPDAAGPHGREAQQMSIAPGEANMDGFHYACVIKQKMPLPTRVPSCTP